MLRGSVDQEMREYRVWSIEYRERQRDRWRVADERCSHRFSPLSSTQSSHLVGRAARVPADDRAGHPCLEAWAWIKNLMRRRPGISGADDRLFSLVANFGVRKAVSEIHSFP